MIALNNQKELAIWYEAYNRHKCVDELTSRKLADRAVELARRLKK